MKISVRNASQCKAGPSSSLLYAVSDHRAASVNALSFQATLFAVADLDDALVRLNPHDITHTTSQV
jgi:hypothetical protein